jgi:hypothetical protein
MQVLEWGCEPHVQPMMALNTLEKKPLVRHDWTEQQLKHLARWANRWLWRSITFAEYQTAFLRRVEHHQQLSLSESRIA